MDDIINIDECLSDSFSLSSDTDIRNIVDQWKHTDLVTENKDQNKYVDTRTFTRPKKKLFSNSDVKISLNPTHELTSSDILSEEQESSSEAELTPTPTSKVNLQIGGLVTSMQRSFLGDVSPPSTLLMESSIEPMENSLITSSDFSNVNEFINGNADSLSMAQFNQYRLSDAINDRNFLERLTNYDDSLFTKDADLNNIDVNNLVSNNSGGSFSGNSTLQNSTDSSTNLAKNDETFVPNKNGEVNVTFNASIEIVNGDQTFTQQQMDTESFAADETLKNDTFDLGNNNKNSTFNTSIKKAWCPINNNETMDMLENEEMSLQGTFCFRNSTKIMQPNETINTTLNLLTVNLQDNSLSPDSESPSYPVNAPYCNAHESTPARRDILKKTRRSEALANISPILSEDLKVLPNRNQTQNVDKFIDVEIDDFPVYMRSSHKSNSRSSNPLAIMNLRDEERQSLKNFEDFENTLLLLESNKNEDEFDDLLNSFSSNVRSPSTYKVRQSLDNIKKRHSLINLEKQHQDELNREKSSNTSLNLSNKGDATLTHDRNKLNDSFNKTALVSSASSCGERLLRRSRLYDDMISTSGSSGNENNYMNTSGSSVSSNDNNKQMHESNAIDAPNKRNQSYLLKDIEKTDNLNEFNADEYQANPLNDAGNETKTNNRDRFKTIRIFKKPPENAVQVPDSDTTYAPAEILEHFSQKNVNSPKAMATNNYHLNENQKNDGKAINTMTFKKSALARPKYLSGISKRDTYAKSSSHEILSHGTYQPEEYANDTKSQNVPPLKSPMGIKSKSTHNLVTTNRIGTNLARASNSSTASTQNNAVFKIPMAKPLVPLRQTGFGIKKLSLLRPSSGYYSYNVKKVDSDTESGRFSSNNSLSSGSSKGSLNRPESESKVNTALATSNLNANATFLSEPASKVINMPNVPSKLINVNANPPRPSGLRLPTQIRKSGLPRPMTIPKK